MMGPKVCAKKVSVRTPAATWASWWLHRRSVERSRMAGQCCSLKEDLCCDERGSEATSGRGREEGGTKTCHDRVRLSAKMYRSHCCIITILGQPLRCK